MFLDVVIVSLLILAFAAGFQRGVLKVFSLLISLFLSVLVLLWILPYYTEFFYASLSQEYQSHYEVGTLCLFSLLVVGFFLALRLLWLNKKSNQTEWLQKAMGGLTMVILMVSTVVTLSGFLQQAELLQTRHVQESRTLTWLQPMQTLGSKIYAKLAESKERYGHHHTGSLP